MVVGDTAVLYAEVTYVVLSGDDQPETFRMPMTQVWVRVGEREVPRWSYRSTQFLTHAHAASR